MNTYEQFLKLDIDTSFIGLEKSDESSEYFCTPIDAEIIGWESGGIHYCFIKGFEEMVFVVNPNGSINEKGESLYVYPVAESFEVFLSLILQAKSVTGIEQVVWFTKEQFIEFVASDENNIIPKQKEVLESISKNLSIIPFEGAYEYIKKIQAEFDYSQLRFTEDYYNNLGICNIKETNMLRSYADESKEIINTVCINVNK